MENKQTEYNQLIAGSLLIIASVCFTIALIYMSSVLIPFILAVFVYYLMSPLINLFHLRLRFPRWLAIVVNFLIIVILFSILVPFLGESITTFINSSYLYHARIIGMFEFFVNLLEQYNIDIGQENMIESLKSIPVLQWTQSIVGNAANILSTTFLVIIFLLFLLLGQKEHRKKTGIWLQIDLKIQRYLLTKLVTSASTGFLVALILTLFGLDLAIVFGVLAFLLNFIPTVGSIIATLLPLPIAILQFSNPLMILGVFIFPAIVQTSIGNIIEPLVMGDSLDLHPAVILLSLIFWGLIWGVTGMLLAAPITAIIKIVCERFNLTRPVAELLAGRLPFVEST